MKPQFMHPLYSHTIQPLFRVLAVCTFCLSVIPAYSQLSGVMPAYTEQTAYGTDIIYFYSSSSNIELTAQHPSGAVASFVWEQYSGSTWNIVKSETATQSSVNPSGEGCYRVTVNDGATSQIFQCWVMVPSITDVSLTVVDSNCFNLSLLANFTTTPLTYVNPADGTSYQINYTPTFRWNNSKDVIEVTQTPTVLLEAPYVDDTYTVTVSTRLLNTSLTSAEVPVSAKAVKAVVAFTNDKAKAGNELHTETEGSAPMKLSFFGEPDGTDERSKGKIDNYTWMFGEAGKDFIANPTFVFQEGGIFPVTLMVENNLGCSNTSEITSIVVKEAIVEVPNFFTPNGDGHNDQFKVAYRSLKTFEMTIVNRWGREVYFSTHANEGWDGQIGGQKASPGVYFYDVVATGYNDNESFHEKGFLHLLSGKQ